MRHGWIIRCVDVVHDAAGEVAELRCTCDMETRSGMPGASRKVKGTIHWVSAAEAVPAEVRCDELLLTVPRPDVDPPGGDFTAYVNRSSRVVERGALLEPCLAGAAPGAVFQFERLGYFVADREEHSAANPCFNRVVTLRDSR